MYLTSLTIDGFKNLEAVSLRPDAGYNIIIGENAQGKTNLLEAVWMMTGCRSFRGSRERDYLSFSGKPLKVSLSFDDGQRQQVLCCEMSPQKRDKKFTCNGVPLKQNSDLFERFHCIAFTPEDIQLVTGSPDVRRSFVDLCYSQLQPRAMAMVRRCQLILAQRNAVLKQHPSAAAADAMLEIWDRQLAAVGVYITRQRSLYLKRLESVCQQLYHEISGGREQIDMQYRSGIFGKNPELPEDEHDQQVQQYYEQLTAHREQDLLLGFTSVGVQRDDILLKINDSSARDFGSQGQKKSLALVMKLAQAQIYGQQRREKPVILLDDVMGELDRNRQAVVCRIVQGMQVFLTTCHDEVLIPDLGGQRILLKNGTIQTPQTAEI